ncbi:hypothetical protein [Microbacterium sp.]|uniref:hypothetical protein n=1 Tax=Microbacterium sp. TaxID=51671 RepID=UPI003C7906E7
MTTQDVDSVSALDITVGGLSREELLAQLSAEGVLLNAHAEMLIAGPAFDNISGGEKISITARSLIDLGLVDGASLSQIYARAEAQGLHLCPPVTAPYLRLATREQASAPDAVLSSRRAPSGSLTVAARAPWEDDELPKGFYLRVIEGQTWLRGYRCDDEHIWSPDDRFAFRSAT